MDQQNSKSKLKEEISFRPVTEGLGFHPFSDGLPYAPVAKGPRISSPLGVSAPNPQQSSSLMGSGAVAAGPQIPLRQSPIRNNGAVPQISVPVVKRSGLADQQVLKGKSEETLFPVEGYGSIYLLKRILAYFLDFALNSILCGIALGAFAVEQDFSLEQLFSTQVVIFVTLFVFVMNWILITSQEVLFRTTLAKKIFGLKLVGGRMQCLLRALFFLPSAGFFALGLLSGVFDRRKCCWHDRLAHLQPLEYTRF